MKEGYLIVSGAEKIQNTKIQKLKGLKTEQ